MIRIDYSGLLLWSDVTLDPALLAGDLAPGSAVATGRLLDDPCDDPPNRTVYVWEPADGGPKYQFVSMSALDPAADALWTGAMIITLPPRALEDLPRDADDPAVAPFPLVENHGSSMSLRLRTLQRAMYTHRADLERALAHVGRALVVAAGLATLREQYQGALMREHGILALPATAVVHACCWCGWIPGRRLPRCPCSRGRGLRYCSKACQRAHWRGGHSEECSAARPPVV
jgi:hypothetical protein